VVPFATARRLRGGGAAPWRPRNRHLGRAFDMVETYPLRAVIVLRLVLWFNPPLSYALAMTGVPPRAYVAGCGRGRAPGVGRARVGTGWVR
jgi:hypothetical protein